MGKRYKIYFDILIRFEKEFFSELCNIFQKIHFLKRSNFCFLIVLDREKPVKPKGSPALGFLVLGTFFEEYFQFTKLLSLWFLVLW